MPWKETNAMEQKEKFITEMLKKEKPFKHLCEEFNISEKTGHKWKNRYHQEGMLGLHEQSRAPKSSPAGLPENVVVEILRLKNNHISWGPKKILALYHKNHKTSETPSLSSVKRIFEKSGLVKRRKVRKATASLLLNKRIQPEACNDVWAIDFKGWWKSNGELCEPFTVRDLHTRYILEVRLMESKSCEAIRAVMTELFKKYGLPKVIRSDNGTPFTSSVGVLSLTVLSAWWITLGIIPDRIDKGKPGQNGSLERFHADIANEIEKKIPGGRRQNQIALDMWREEYNCVRPNEAIGMLTPAELYTPSERKYEGDYDDIEYPPGFLPRKVQCNGIISIDGFKITISNSLRGLTVGLKFIDTGKYMLFLADFLLGEVYTDLCCFIPRNDL